MSWGCETDTIYTERDTPKTSRSERAALRKKRLQACKGQRFESILAFHKEAAEKEASRKAAKKKEAAEKEAAEKEATEKAAIAANPRYLRCIECNKDCGSHQGTHRDEKLCGSCWWTLKRPYSQQ